MPELNVKWKDNLYHRQLNLLAPVGTTGYGVTGFNVLKTLTEREWTVALFPYGPHGRVGSDAMLIDRAISQAQMFFHDAPCLNIWHQFELSHSIGKGKYIGWPIFELDTFNVLEKHHMFYPDQLIVCSEWAKSVIGKIYGEKYDLDTKALQDQPSDWLEGEINRCIKVVPLGVDHSIFNTRNKTSSESRDTIFLNVGKWEVRKGHDILCDVFNNAFSVTDNVQLWLCPHNNFITPSDRLNWENMYLQSPMGKAGKIKIHAWQKEHKDLANLMSQATCGVFPSRAEGWNLELLEMMAMGKPVIATNYSAHTAFCNSDNCMLIDIDDLELAYDGKWFFEQGHWAALDERQCNQLKHHMQVTHEVHRHQHEYTNDAGIQTAKSLTWDNSISILEKILLDNR